MANIKICDICKKEIETTGFFAKDSYAFKYHKRTVQPFEEIKCEMCRSCFIDFANFVREKCDLKSLEKYPKPPI